MIEPLSRPEIEEMREAVAASEAPVVRVPRATLLRILATPYRTAYRDLSKPGEEVTQTIEVKVVLPNPIPTPTQVDCTQTKKIGPTAPDWEIRKPHPNARIAEFEKRYPHWIMREVDLDTTQYSQRVKNYCTKNNVRYARIQATAGTIRYYAPDKVTMSELMKVLGHE